MRDKDVQIIDIDGSMIPRIQESHAQQKDYTLHALLGGASGLFMEGSLHPIDTIRTRIKSNTQRRVPFTEQTRSMYRIEGPKSYFGGLTCTLTGSFIANTAYFYTYERLKHSLVRRQLMSKETAPFAAAFVGGFLANMVYLPFDVVRTRMQLKPGSYDYKHFFDGAYKILKYEGFRKLYLGGPAFFTLNALETGLTFGFYELFHTLLEPLFPTTREVNLPLAIVCSVSAASLAGLVISPLDIIVTRIQSVNTTVHGTQNSYQIAKQILRNEGVTGFFKGATGTMGYYALGALILFPTYEVLKNAFGVDLSEEN